MTFKFVGTKTWKKKRCQACWSRDLQEFSLSTIVRCMPREYMECLFTNVGLRRIWFGLGFLVLYLEVVYNQSQPTKHYLLWGNESGPICATFNLSFVGLGWTWVGEFVSFTIKSSCFSTQKNLVNSKHRNVRMSMVNYILGISLRGCVVFRT